MCEIIDYNPQYIDVRLRFHDTAFSMPDDRVLVLVVTAAGRWCLGFYDYSTEEWYHENGVDGFVSTVTLWSNIPNI